MFEPATLDLARQLGAMRMARAEEHAERVEPGFAQRAFVFLLAWLSWRGIGEAFSAETVVDLAREHGITPPDTRAWGPVFRRAAGVGAIKRSSTVFPRAKGHGTATLGWERVR